MNQAAHRRPLFGELAIRAGWLGPEHVNWALSVQAERKSHNVHLYVAQILVNQKYITVDQAVQILRHQRVQIMVDPETQYRYNVHNYDPRKQYKSPESTGTLQTLSRPDSLAVRGDIGLRHVQKTQAATPGHGGADGGWSPDAAVGTQTVWEEEWEAPAGQSSATASGSASDSAGTRPVFAELSSEEKASSNNDDYDWYGQTILDDGSLAEQLKRAAAESAESIPEPPDADAVGMAEALAAQPDTPVGTVSSASGVRAKAGTVAFLALPHGAAGDRAYRALTDLCAAKGIGTVRMDDVADMTSIWKGIERFLSGAALTIADLSGDPRPAAHVGHQVKYALRVRKPVLVLSHTPSTTAKAARAVGLNAESVVGYPSTGDHQELAAAVETALDRMLSANQLVG